MDIILDLIAIVFFVYVLWLSIGIYANYKMYRKITWFSKLDAFKHALQNIDYY